MEDQSFETLTRRSTSVSRRGSMTALAATGIFAALARPFMAAAAEAHTAKKGGKKKRGKNQPVPPPLPPVDQCLPQVAPCKTIQAAACGDEPFCPEFVQCCDLLGTCDAAGFFTCIAVAQRA